MRSFYGLTSELPNLAIFDVCRAVFCIHILRATANSNHTLKMNQFGEYKIEIYSKIKRGIRWKFAGSCARCDAKAKRGAHKFGTLPRSPWSPLALPLPRSFAQRIKGSRRARSPPFVMPLRRALLSNFSRFRFLFFLRSIFQSRRRCCALCCCCSGFCCYLQKWLMQKSPAMSMGEQTNLPEHE